MRIEASTVEPLGGQADRQLADMLTSVCLTGEGCRLSQGDGHPLGAPRPRCDLQAPVVVLRLTIAVHEQHQAQPRADLDLGREVVQFDTVGAMQRQSRTQLLPVQTALEQGSLLGRLLCQPHRGTQPPGQLPYPDHILLTAHITAPAFAVGAKEIDAGAKRFCPALCQTTRRQQ